MDLNLLLLICSSSTLQSLSVHVQYRFFFVTSVFTSIFRWSLLCVHQAWASGCGRRHYPMELSSCPSCAKGCPSCSVWQCCHCETSRANTTDSSLFWLIDHRGVLIDCRFDAVMTYSPFNHVSLVAFLHFGSWKGIDFLWHFSFLRKGKKEQSILSIYLIFNMVCPSSIHGACSFLLSITSHSYHHYWILLAGVYIMYK